ncbi:MAG TPA: biotin/lipoyl-binding protein, partial [Steroidobacteraceae bacterium]|nr:biotin/lipoyl-binding protein [Steroidobacteraceae bacterium]
MRTKAIFITSAVGFLLALVSAFIFSRTPKPQPPLFTPAANPYAHGIYSNGIIESEQAQGQNINIYPEVAGPITRVLVAEGQTVHQGDALLTIDDSVQRATAEQQQAQSEAAHALWRELKAQPRPENLAVARSQALAAAATLKTAEDQRDKLKRSYELQPKSVSRGDLDNAENAVRVAAAGLEVAQKQLDLVRAGAWSYDIKNQESQCDALAKAVTASTALLNKYAIRAPVDGPVLAINAAVGSYVSAQGSYDGYTQGYL